MGYNGVVKKHLITTNNIQFLTFSVIYVILSTFRTLSIFCIQIIFFMQFNLYNLSVQSEKLKVQNNNRK